MRWFGWTLSAVLWTTACGGGAKEERRPEVPVAEPIVEEDPPLPPTYVIVHRNTPNRLRPTDDAPFLQYRTPERQAELDERRDQAEAERLEAEKVAETERLEKEKERRAKNLKRRRKYSKKKRAELAERDKERAERDRVQRAERRLRDIRKRALAEPLAAPDRAFIPFQLIRRKRGWLQLSPVRRDAEPAHCYAKNFGEVDRLDATFWVKESDLETVTTRSVSVAPTQGTQVVLRPGVAVRPLGPDTPDAYSAHVDGFVLTLTIPPDAVGTQYEPERQFEAPMTDTVFTAVAWAEEKLQLAPRVPFPYNPYRDLFVTGTLFVGSRFYVTTQTPCGEYTIRAREEYVEPVGKRGVMRLSGGDEVVPAPYARAGSMSYTPDGDPFAQVRQNFPLGVATRTVEARQCFRSAVWGDTDAIVSRSLELCFDADDLVLVAPAK